MARWYLFRPIDWIVYGFIAYYITKASGHACYGWAFVSIAIGIDQCVWALIKIVDSLGQQGR
jgi:hypothetical protein